MSDSNGRRRVMAFMVNDHLYPARHRIPVLKAASRDGWRVHAIAPARSDALGELEREGFECHGLRLARRSANPLAEARALASLVTIYRTLQPDLVYHATIKPVLYGSIAARWARVPAVVNAITGLGYIYSDEARLARHLRPLVNRVYRVAFRHPNVRVIFQNRDDWALLEREAGVPPEHARLIPGSGVDIELFHPGAEPEGPPLVVLVARMLWEKGVREFVEAARILKARGSAARFVLVGETDPGNPSGIPESKLREWAAEGTVEWWGHREDMAEVFRSAQLVTLPSYYREGLPKVLIEAAACGRPVIAADAPGCRDAVIHGETGILVPPRDGGELAEAIASLLASPERRRAMGAAGRERAVRDYSTEVIVNQTMRVFDECFG